MKLNLMKIYHPMIAAVSLVFAAGLGSCTDFDWHQEHDTTLSEFDIMSEEFPQIVIAADKSNINDEHTVAWSGSTAGDYTQVFYKVLFSTDGDFSNPVYELEPEQMGTAGSLTLTNHTLNIAAERAGIKQGATGRLRFTVRATNGVAVRMCKSVRELEITRPAGYAYNPESVSLVGSDMAPVVTHKVADGVFEVFAWLGSGEYKLTEDGSAIGRSFGIDGAVLAEDGKIVPVTPGRIHRISVDFNDATATLSAVEEVGLWYSAANDVIAVMQPALNKSAVWSAEFDFNVEKNDYRYKFRMKEMHGDGSSTTVFYGYQKSTAGFQNSSSPAAYFELYPEDGESQSSYCFRFNNTGLHAGKKLRVTADFTPVLSNYTHKVEVL